MTETPKTIRAHKIKLNPTAEQAEYFAKCAGIARFCFNWSLARWKEIKATGQKASFNGIKKEFRAKSDGTEQNRKSTEHDHAHAGGE